MRPVNNLARCLEGLEKTLSMPCDMIMAYTVIRRLINDCLDLGDLLFISKFLNWDEIPKSIPAHEFAEVYRCNRNTRFI